MQGHQKAQVTMTADVLIPRMLENDPRQLQVLLIRRQKDPYAGMWALPGGKLNEDDASLEDAAKREVQEETGIRIRVLQQVYTFSKKERDPRGRYVSTLYMAAMQKENVAVHAGDDACDAEWFSLHALPHLAFDHRKMLRTAMQLLYMQAALQVMRVEG